MAVWRGLLLVPLAVGLNGCLALSILSSLPVPEEAAVVEAQPVAVEAGATEEPVAAVDYLAEGKRLGYAAAVSAGTAQGEGAWDAVAVRWQGAMDALGQVPQDSPDYGEAQAKLAEYDRNRLAALANRDALRPAEGAEALETFWQAVQAADPDGTLVQGATLSPHDAGTLEVTVTMDFLTMNKEVQRETAVGLQRIWASASSPTKPDSAYLWLRTPSGKRFGGSRSLGGTLIYIDD